MNVNDPFYASFVTLFHKFGAKIQQKFDIRKYFCKKITFLFAYSNFLL